MFRFTKRTVDEFIGVFLAIFLISAAFLSVRAAQVTAVSDTMSRGKVSTAANHNVVFVTPSGAAEGSTMSVTFPTGFGTSGMTADDVDLFDNGLPVSTAADCYGTEQAAAVWLGNTLSFQICPGDGGAFAPGSTVSIVIGTDAVDYGVGVNRVINPAVSGAYRLAIGGSFGDTGSAPISIGLDDQVGVTACIGEACNIAPPPPPVVIQPVIGGSSGPGQTPAPRMIGVTIDQITVTTARISWQTDIASNSYVRYGLSSSYGQVYGINDYVTDHSLVLIGLKPGTTYHLAARSMGVFGDVAISADQTFTTLSVKKAVLPQISDIVLESIGGTEVVVSWKTDVPTYWEIDFGRTDNYGNEVNNGVFDTAHTTTLGNLSPNTTYHFHILATDANGDQAYSPDQSFTTFDTIAPAISLAHVEFITPHSADVVWQTNKPATGGVRFGPSALYEGGEAIETTGFATLHRVSLTNLNAGTLYHYKIFQTDHSGNDAQSADQIFLTGSIVAVPMPPGPNKPEIPGQGTSKAVAIGSGQIIATVNGVPAEITANLMNAIVDGIIGLQLPDSLTSKTTSSALVQVGNDTYAFTQGTDGAYRVFFAASASSGTVPVTVTIKYADGASVYASWKLEVVPGGTIFENVNGTKVPVPGAKVTILKNGMPWDGSVYGQNGYEESAPNGGYGFFVPKDTYSLKIEKNGYKTKIIEIKPSLGPINEQIGLDKETPKIVSLPKNLVNFAKFAASQPACVFPWMLLLMVALFLIRRYVKQKAVVDETIRSIFKK